LKMSSIAL